MPMERPQIGFYIHAYRYLSDVVQPQADHRSYHKFARLQLKKFFLFVHGQPRKS